MTALSARIRGIGVLGPGLSDWSATASVLRGSSPYQGARTVLPLPEVLPPAERRRSGRVVKLALAVAAQATTQAGIDVRTLASVFSSSGGDGDNCHEVCAALASAERQISPTRFHNSVHNAASGYWGIGYGCMQASTALCAYDASFGAGLIEALSQLHAGAPAVLLVAYDADYPPPLFATRPIPDAFGVAMVLTPDGAAGPRLALQLGSAPPDPMQQPELEALRGSIPAARSLPLLRALAHAAPDRVVLEYLPGQSLCVELSP